MTLHLKIQKFIPYIRKIFQQEQGKQFVIALEVNASQRIRYLMNKGQIVSNERMSLVNNIKDVYCTSGLQQSIQIVLYQRQKRIIDKEPIHMERQKMIRVATIHSDTLLKLYQQNQCKNMEECIINVQLKTRQREHYLIKRDLPTDDFDCKVDLAFKYDKFRICHGNMPLSKVIHNINLSWKKEINKYGKTFNQTNQHEQTFNSTKQDLVQDANKSLKLSQKVKFPDKKEDQPTKLTQQQFLRDKQFYAGRCATTNIFSFCDNLFAGIDDSSIKFQIVEEVYR